MATFLTAWGGKYSPDGDVTRHNTRVGCGGTVGNSGRLGLLSDEPSLKRGRGAPVKSPSEGRA
eukprot:scaffold557_cov89-Skeletonema_dohrnii-CCMP3373.AAC.4